MGYTQAEISQMIRRADEIERALSNAVRNRLDPERIIELRHGLAQAKRRLSYATTQQMLKTTPD